MPLPAAAFDLPRANAQFQFVDDDDDDDRGGYWHRLDGRWVPQWALHDDDRWDDDDDDRWDDDWDDDDWDGDDWNDDDD
ncbi:hypothetical protein VE25_01960 [Devosia geojensis]|uniref:Uncharacterized protein n=1 Tax=Devosia geojensis TaxID=443610 RepID=A0A0F5FX86_9HYPH|nr:hypothetical protein VE25_01960 [Devosia geojensis]